MAVVFPKLTRPQPLPVARASDDALSPGASSSSSGSNTRKVKRGFDTKRNRRIAIWSCLLALPAVIMLGAFGKASSRSAGKGANPEPEPLIQKPEL
jgi:hypothetical protein